MGFMSLFAMSLFGPGAGFPPLGTDLGEPAESSSIPDTNVQDTQIPQLDFPENDVQSPIANPFLGNYTEDEDAEDEDYERPNRFRGKPSTYRSWIADEREMYDSMIHIWIDEKFSSELVRQRRETAIDMIGDESFSWRSTKRWHDQKHDTIMPTKHLSTLWPLKPSRVPALDEDWDKPKNLNREKVLRAGNILESSKALEELLIAHGLRTARQRWESRASNSSECPTQTAGSGIHNQNDDELPWDLLDRSDSEPESASQHALKETKQRVEEQDFPVFSADDDLSARLLQKSVRAILPKLDKLLLALHSSRQGQQEARITGKRKRSSETLSSSDESTINEDEHVSPSLSDVSSTEEQESKKKRRNYVRKLEPRDWSEVLGTAALVGWDTASLKAAAQHCSSTFREDMAFTTLREDSKISRHSLNKHFASQKPPELEDMEEKWSLETLICPHEGCPRHHEKFTVIKQLTRHIKQVHDWDPANRIPETRLKVGGIHVDGFMCPIPAQKGWSGVKKSAEN